MIQLSVKELAVNYGDFRALHNVSFDLEKGEFLAIVGPNGSGKSTLIHTLLGLKKPNEGSVNFPEGKPYIGYLPQKSFHADPRFPATVEEIVTSGIIATKSFPRRITDSDRERVLETLKLLRIEDIRKRKIGRLSGGQQQRALLARALVGNPEILVLDEPTGALDPGSRDCFYTTLKEMNQKHGITVLMVSHDTHDIDAFATKLLYLDQTPLYYGSIEDFSHTNMGHYFNHNHDLHGGASC